MERLSIDEIIAHCERQIERNENAISKEYFETEEMSGWSMHEYWEHRQVAEYLKELKAYRDAEEQGLLLRLPCKVGDTFWELNDNFLEPAIYPRKAHSLQHVLYCMDRLGKVTFLTKEEAEQKLASMQKGE